MLYIEMIGRDQSTPETSPESSRTKQSQTDRRPTTPFKRSRSRVFYSSDVENRSSFSNSSIRSLSSPLSTSALMSNVAKSRHKEVFGATPSNISNTTSYTSPELRSLPTSSPISSSLSYSDSRSSFSSPTSDVTSSPSSQIYHSVITEDANDRLSPEHQDCSSKIHCSTIDSPGGSLRGSPSHRSQDSGYSDSGESHSGGINDSDEAASPPQVKHITRVYFGDLNNQTKLYNDKIVCSPESREHYNEVRTTKSSRRRSSTSTNSYDNSLNSSIKDRKNSSVNSDSSLSPSTPEYSHSPTHFDFNNHFEELDHHVEHKQISPKIKTPVNETKKFKGILRNSKENQKNLDELSIEEQRKTGAIKKTSIFSGSWGKRYIKRSKSIEKLTDAVELRPKRNVILKAKRRWSSIDLRLQKYTKESKKAVNSQCPVESLPCIYDTARASKLCDLQEDVTLESCPVQEQKEERKNSGRKLKIHPAALALEMKNSSLHQWLNEARGLCESECMNTLQSKSLCVAAGTSSRQSAAAAREAVVIIQKRAHEVSAEFARLCQRLEKQRLHDIDRLSISLVSHITTFLQDHAYHQQEDGNMTSLERQSRVVNQICKRLLEESSKLIENMAEQNNDVTPSNGDVTTEHDMTNVEEDKLLTTGLVQMVTALGHAFTKIVDIMLSREIKILVTTLEDTTRDIEVKAAISHLTALGVDGGHLCRLISKLGGVRALLEVCLDPHFLHLRVAALRALATVCCVVEGIVQLEKTGGIEVVSEVLCDREAPEDERSEAAAVIAQITSPWVEDNHVLVWLHPQTSAIIKALTELAQDTDSAEIFLLATAALANLTFLDVTCVEDMKAAGTPRVILEACTEGRHISVFTKDQIATVLANLSGNEQTAKDVISYGGVEVLVSLLHTTTPDYHRVAEVAATERVQQKSAIALSRLCSNEETARATIDLGGAERLAHLCRDENERNNSDAVLVACLSTLRKISNSCSPVELEEFNVAELVEPRLLDSFLIYSSKQESYV